MNLRRTIRHSIIGMVATISAAPAWAQVTTVKINEFVKDERTQGTGTISPDTREFIEFYNSGATAVDLSNYTIRTTNRTDAATTNDLLPAGASIAPGGYFVVAVQGRGIVGANHYITLGATEEMLPDSKNLLIELLDNNSLLIDAVLSDAYRAPQLGSLDPPLLAQVGTGLQGRAESYNPPVPVVPVPNTTMTYARYRDGVDTNKNGRDFGYLPVTPGASNTLPTVPAHLVPNVDALAVGSFIADYNASFVAPRVIAPGTVDIANPKMISPSPQGGNAISAWDETGGGNVVYSKNYVNKFDLYAYLDTTDLNMATADWEAEWTAYGIGSTDPQFRTPNSNGLVPDGAGSIVGENGSTGIGWFYERFQKVDGSDTAKLSLIDFGQGGDSLPTAQTPGDDKWDIIQTFDLTPAQSGWHRLSIDYNPTTGDVVAKFDENTVPFNTDANQVGAFYAGYREGMSGVPADATFDFVSKVRPATWDMIAAAPTNNANFDATAGSERVDGRDFLIWQRNFGSGSGTQATGDANGNGQVNTADYDIWKAQLGTIPATASAAAIPEPAAGALGLIALAALAAGWRRQ